MFLEGHLVPFFLERPHVSLIIQCVIVKELSVTERRMTEATSFLLLLAKLRRVHQAHGLGGEQLILKGLVINGVGVVGVGVLVVRDQFEEL